MNKLKLWLIAHHGNDHRPHLVRRRGIIAVLALVIGIQLAGSLTTAAGAGAVPLAGQVLGYGTDISAGRLIEQTNAERAKAGLAPLSENAQLDASARAKAADMFAADYWAHNSPSGIKPWHWFDQAGYTYDLAGENLAKDFDLSSGVTAGWMNSPGHRANILNTDYRDIGLAVVNGTLQGRETTLVVAHYGRQRDAVAIAASALPAVAAPAPSVAPFAPAATPARASASTLTLPIAPATTPTGAPANTPVASVGMPAATPTTVPLAVVAGVQTVTAAPPAANYGLFAPLALTDTLGWPMLATLGLLLLVLGVYLGMHARVWWHDLPRWSHRHYRLVATLQVGGVAGLMLVIAASGLGRVG